MSKMRKLSEVRAEHEYVRVFEPGGYAPQAGRKIAGRYQCACSCGWKSGRINCGRESEARSFHSDHVRAIRAMEAIGPLPARVMVEKSGALGILSSFDGAMYGECKMDGDWRPNPRFPVCILSPAKEGC